MRNGSSGSSVLFAFYRQSYAWATFLSVVLLKGFKKAIGGQTGSLVWQSVHENCIISQLSLKNVDGRSRFNCARFFAKNFQSSSPPTSAVRIFGWERSSLRHIKASIDSIVGETAKGKANAPTANFSFFLLTSNASHKIYLFSRLVIVVICVFHGL